MVRPVPVQPDIDSKKAERKSIVTRGSFLLNPIIINGIVPISEMKIHPSAAVTIALLKFARSAFLKIRYKGVPTIKNKAEVIRIAAIPNPSEKYKGAAKATRDMKPTIINIPPRSLRTVLKSLIYPFSLLYDTVYLNKRTTTSLYFYLFLISFILVVNSFMRSSAISLFVNASALAAVVIFAARTRAIFPRSALGDLFNSEY